MFVAQRVVVTFVIDGGSGLNRHRVSVWDDAGGLLRGPSAQSPGDLEVQEGTTLFVEASVPAEARRNKARTRDEQRWELRACPSGHAVLRLGTTPEYGPGSAIEIHVDGAEQQGNPRKAR